MSNETREIRGKVPVAIGDRIDNAVQVLGVPQIEIVAAAVANGLEETLADLARRRAEELATFLPPPANGTAPEQPVRKPVSAARKVAVAAEEKRQRKRLEAQNRDQRTAEDKLPRTRGTGR